MVWAHSFGNIFEGRKTEQENGEGVCGVRGGRRGAGGGWGCFPIPCQINKSRLSAFPRVERGSEGDTELEIQGGR